MAPDPKIAHVQILNGMQAGPARSWNPWHLQRGIFFPPWPQLLLLLSSFTGTQERLSTRYLQSAASPNYERASAGTFSLYILKEYQRSA